jgi:signal transduction histidine kinase
LDFHDSRKLNAHSSFRGISNTLSVASINDEVPDMIEQDEKKIGQVLVNLIDNAIKYTSIGSIRVTVKLLSNRQLDDLHSIESVDSLEEDSTNP